MFNPHPFLSSLPIGIALVLIALEWLAEDRAAKTTAVILALATSLAFLSGYWAIEPDALCIEINKIEAVVSQHHTLGRLTMIAAIIAAACRSYTDIKWLHYTALVILLCLIVCTGYLGGSLVFDHGAGVC